MKIIKNDIYIILSEVLNVDITTIKNISENVDLTEYGLTSLSAIRMVIMIENKYMFELNTNTPHLVSPQTVKIPSFFGTCVTSNSIIFCAFNVTTDAKKQKTIIKLLFIILFDLFDYLFCY